MSAADIHARKLADADIATMRRTGIRPPFIRNWGVATSARPYRRSAAVGWWALVAAVAACAVVIVVSL